MIKSPLINTCSALQEYFRAVGINPIYITGALTESEFPTNEARRVEPTKEDSTDVNALKQKEEEPMIEKLKQTTAQNKPCKI